MVVIFGPVDTSAPLLTQKNKYCLPAVDTYKQFRLTELCKIVCKTLKTKIILFWLVLYFSLWGIANVSTKF